MRGNSNTQTYPTLQKRTQSDFYDKKEVLKLSVFLFFFKWEMWLKNISTGSEDTFRRTVVTFSPCVFNLDSQF